MYSAEVSAEQGSAVVEVANRFYAERQEEANPGMPTSEPLRKLVHGKPGTGKSAKCIGLVVKFLEEIAGYKRGVEYHLCTLQTFLAAKLGGQTMHHVAGINPFLGGANNAEAHVSENTQTRFLLTRYLAIDEIFMCSAQFFAEFEIACRTAIPATSPFRMNGFGARPFGGLNVFGVGDAYQLDCPEGVPLYTVPSVLLGDAAVKEDSPMVARGLALLWGQEGGQGFQSAIDLTEPFRCKDPWWNATLDEFRYLVLTKDTHAFLHGTETTVPGSWFENRAACDNDECKKLPHTHGVP